MVKTIKAIVQVLVSMEFTDTQLSNQLKNQIKELDSKTPVTKDLLEQWISALVNQLEDKSKLGRDVTGWWQNTEGAIRGPNLSKMTPSQAAVKKYLQISLSKTEQVKYFSHVPDLIEGAWLGAIAYAAFSLYLQFDCLPT